MKKAIVYLNQFFGQIGGEDKADFKPEIREGLVGASMEFNKQLQNATVTHTIICGDNYMGSNEDKAVEEIMAFLEDKEFDIFIAGPAFQAGRYGNACGVISLKVKEKYNIPVLSSMHIENPGVEMFKKDMIIFPGGKSAASMRKDIKKIVKYADKLLVNEKVGTAEEEGYYTRGIRHQIWRDDKVCAADRVIDMLLKKVNNEKFVSELPIPKMDKVAVATPISDLTKAKIAVLTTSGIVPVANPDRIQSASATRWGKYDISNMEKLESGIFKTIHAGFDPAAADADPNVCVPIDSFRVYEKEGTIGELYNYFYSTVGTGTTQAEAARMGKEIVIELLAAGVDGVIMTST